MGQDIETILAEFVTMYDETLGKLIISKKKLEESGSGGGEDEDAEVGKELLKEEAKESMGEENV